MAKKNIPHPGHGRQERFIQASILMGLCRGASYGYELISTIQTYGFIEGSAPPGMIYRHLRQMEEDNLVLSEWETKDAGAAKRIYTITDEGREILAFWVRFMEDRAEKLSRFASIYREMDATQQDT